MSTLSESTRRTVLWGTLWPPIFSIEWSVTRSAFFLSRGPSGRKPIGLRTKPGLLSGRCADNRRLLAVAARIASSNLTASGQVAKPLFFNGRDSFPVENFRFVENVLLFPP